MFSLKAIGRFLNGSKTAFRHVIYVMEKEILALKLEKENNSLRAEVSQLEAQHTANLSDIEKKHKQNLDQMAVKMTEVKYYI